MPSITRRHGVATLALAAVATVPAAALAAQPGKDGAYYAASKKGQESIQVNVTKHRIVGAQASLRYFKRGKACRMAGSSVAGPITSSFDLKRSVKPSRTGEFSFTSSTAYKPKVTLKVTGRFTSSKTATLTIVGSFNGCSGSYSSSKAKLTQFG